MIAAPRRANHSDRCVSNVNSTSLSAHLVYQCIVH